MVTTCLQLNSTTHWADRPSFVNVTWNKAYHESLKYSPYEYMFEKEMKVGLKTYSSLIKQLIKSIQKENTKKSFTLEKM